MRACGHDVRWSTYLAAVGEPSSGRRAGAPCDRRRHGNPGRGGGGPRRGVEGMPEAIRTKNS